jgi:hypothetical protein
MESSDQANNERNNHQMSGIYNTANNDDQMFSGERTEFGMCVFSDPHTQAAYQKYEDEYKKKYALHQAYNKQEFLRRMRADIKREYLTRKKQLKHLQKDAAIDFRNAEMSLQEHYASTQASQLQSEYSHRAVDICAPLVSQVTLPDGQLFDVKTFNLEGEFAKLVQNHKNLVEQQNESYRQWWEEEQRQREWEAANTASWGRFMQHQQEDPTTTSTSTEWWNQTPPTPAKDEEEEEESGTPSQYRGAFGGCYDDDEYSPQEGYNLHDEESELDDEILDSNNKWGMSMTALEKNILEEGEEAEKRLENEPNQDFWGVAEVQRAVMRANSLFEFLKERAVIEEHKAMEIPDCLQIPDEPASTGSSITAPKSKKPKAHVTTTKPRNNKQQQQRKFVPLKVTENTNRTNEVTAILTANKLEINVPKRKLQNMEAMKRNNRKWKSINTEHKQSAARGTRIADLPQAAVFDYYNDNSD